GIPGALEGEGALPHVGVLTLQHRMSPGICNLVSRLFYRDRLRTADPVLNRIALPSPLGGGDVFYIDSSQSKPSVRRAYKASRENGLHVDLIEDLLAELDSGGAITKTGHLAVAVISPFRGQVHALKKRLGNRYTGRAVKVTTAHGGQGDEAEIVILDLTDAPGLPVSGFLGSTRHPEEGARLLNVSMSRARQQLYVIGALHHLERFGNHITRDLIDYLRENTELVPLHRFRGSAAQVYGPRPSRVA
ncbi:MAG: C-terminal helicase domain-containing protein, partial [Gemmatimonadaceae bacterium]|nr:C-terminal helicase domain-containing protein [Gemmatimonadaceae bacterium]